MTYASMFAQGEQDAFKDRREGRQMKEFEEPRDEDERGYIDGYSPRSATWWRVDQTAERVALRLQQFGV